MIEYIKRKKKNIFKATIVILFLVATGTGMVEYAFRYSIVAIVDLIVNIEMVLDIKADKEKLLTDDFRLFQDTEAWNLAKAVKWQNTSEIRRQISEQKVPVDFREERYGQTLLMLAVMNNKYKSIKLLLDLGADPNIHNDSVSFRGTNSVIIASRWRYVSSKSLELILQYGGNPNSISSGVYESSPSDSLSPYRVTPLSTAAQYSLDKVKLLVDFGADINLIAPFSNECALESALNSGKIEIVLFLLKNGANYNITFSESILMDSKKVDILYKLRQCIYPIGSEKHITKMKVIDFLQKRGLNYWDSEIPDYILEKIKTIYPKDWEEYIKKY